MSLRSFHIFFICVASLMTAGMSWMEYVNWQETGGSIHLTGSCAGAAAALGLLVYAVFFFRKTRKLAS